MEKSIKIEGSKNVVTGTGNRVVQKITEIYHALGKKQFIALVGGLLVLLLAGIIGFEKTDTRQELIYASVDDVESELKTLFQNNEALRTQLGDKQEVILKAISDGVRLLNGKDYTKAIEKFESIPQDVPLAGIYNNIGYAYAQMGNKDQAEAYFRAALKTEPSYQAAQDNLKLLSYGLKSRYWAVCSWHTGRDNPTYSVKVEVNGQLVTIVHLSVLNVEITQKLKPGINKARFIATKTAPETSDGHLYITIGPGIFNKGGNLVLTQTLIQYRRNGRETSNFDETFEFLAE